VCRFSSFYAPPPPEKTSEAPRSVSGSAIAEAITPHQQNASVAVSASTRTS
jgi:hypothetical protein